MQFRIICCSTTCEASDLFLVLYPVRFMMVRLIFVTAPRAPCTYYASILLEGLKPYGILEQLSETGSRRESKQTSSGFKPNLARGAWWQYELFARTFSSQSLEGSPSSPWYVSLLEVTSQNATGNYSRGSSESDSLRGPDLYH